MADPSNAWIRMSSAELSIEVDPLGAQLSSLRDSAGRDLLWTGDPSVWAGRAPLLFPIVGALVDGTYRLGARNYKLPRHGFARGKRFDVIDASARRATFLLRADAATLEVYPFQFELQVHFVLDGATLTVTTRVFNAGAEEMPASVGYHPAFRWPLPFGQERSAHVVEFEHDEPAGIRRLDAAGLLTAVRHPTPIVDRRLVLKDALFQEDVVIWDEFNSHSVTYGSRVGPRLKVAFPDAEYLGLWSKPGAQFVCIEPWHGIADPQGFSGDFTAKPGIAIIAPGASLETRLEVALLTS